MNRRLNVSSDPTSSGNIPILSLTPAQFSELVAAKLDEVCASVSAWGLPVVVTGVLGDLPVPRYGTFYRLPLVDPDVPAVATYLNVKDVILDRAGVGTGDRVRVTGSVTAELFRGEMSVRLYAIAVEHEVPEAVPQQRSENLTVDTLRRLALDRHSFPSMPQPTVVLIHSAASTARVADDFLGALGLAISSKNVQRIPTSMQDPIALAGALRTARADIVAVVWGGGDPMDFAVFERSKVLEALSACRGYRVLGLGHSANRTLAELVADHAASTPAAAGEHVRRRIADGRRQTRGEGTIAELREALEREQALRRTEAQTATITLEPVEPEFPVEVFDRQSIRARIVALFWAAVVGAVVAWAVLRWM